MNNFLQITITHKQTYVAIFHTTQTPYNNVTDCHKHLVNCTSPSWKLNLLEPRTCFSKHKIQSTAALENTSGLSVSRNTSKTSSKACKWLILASSCDGLADSFTTRRAPNKGRQPDRISVRFASTNSQMQLTICKVGVMNVLFFSYLKMPLQMHHLMW